VLNRAIRESLNLVDPLAHDRNSRRRTRNKIPSVNTLKSSNLLSHSKLPLRMSNSISIDGRLIKGDSGAWRLIRHKGRRGRGWWRMRMMSIVIENGKDVKEMVEKEVMKQVMVVEEVVMKRAVVVKEVVVKHQRRMKAKPSQKNQQIHERSGR
jgi:hypothetical protein